MRQTVKYATDSEENTIHALWSCDYVKQVWDSSKINRDEDGLNITRCLQY